MKKMTGFDLILQLQDWFRAECNDDWEHSYGFKLETLDNPGWTFEADLAETQWEGLNVDRIRTVRSDSDWLQHEVIGNKYIACGGTSNLQEMLQAFFEFLDSHREESTSPRF